MQTTHAGLVSVASVVLAPALVHRSASRAGHHSVGHHNGGRTGSHRDTGLDIADPDSHSANHSKGRNPNHISDRSTEAASIDSLGRISNPGSVDRCNRRNSLVVVTDWHFADCTVHTSTPARGATLDPEGPCNRRVRFAHRGRQDNSVVGQLHQLMLQECSVGQSAFGMSEMLLQGVICRARAQSSLVRLLAAKVC